MIIDTLIVTWLFCDKLRVFGRLGCWCIAEVRKYDCLFRVIKVTNGFKVFSILELPLYYYGSAFQDTLKKQKQKQINQFEHSRLLRSVLPFKNNFRIRVKCITSQKDTSPGRAMHNCLVKSIRQKVKLHKFISWFYYAILLDMMNYSKLI